MKTRTAIDRGRARQLYRTLRDHLSHSADGRQLIAAFEASPDQASSGLADYLRRQLPGDEALAQRLAAALGEDQAKFATIVTGGQVDQIVNIARVGLLSLTINKYFYVFRGVRQVVAFAIILLGVVAGVVYLAWSANQPYVMPAGDFNIAVAQFAEVSERGETSVAPAISRLLADYLDSSYQAGDFGARVNVQYAKIGVIDEATDAERLAQSISATLVIYGDVFVTGSDTIVRPKFWVATSLQPDTREMTGAGQYQLDYPFRFSQSERADLVSGVSTVLRPRSLILVEFTKALVYRQSHRFDHALDAIESAIREAETYGHFDGQETLYLYAAEISRQRGNLAASQQYVDLALQTNPKYARAYIAQANIYYDQAVAHIGSDQDNFDKAAQYYTQAIQLNDPQSRAFVPEKAHLGLGNIANYRFQAQPTDTQAAQDALLNFSLVITSYQQARNPYLKELAAWAYYGSGIIYQIQGQAATARNTYQQALDLTDDANLKKRAQTRLDQLPGS
jgi:tetratricopeptide (TPR) repeat protein